MPAAVAVPLIGAGIKGAFDVAGHIADNKARGKALQYEQHNADAALAYQKERAGVEDARYAQRWNAYQDYVAAWKQRNGYGTGPGPTSGAGSSGVAPSGLNLASLGGASPQAMPGSAPMPGAAGPAADQAQGSPTLADVSKWNDWRNYGTA